GGGAHGGTFTKIGAGTLDILGANGQQDDIFSFGLGTIIVEDPGALGRGDTGVRVDMKDATTLILRCSTATAFATPINVSEPGAAINVTLDRAGGLGAGVTY